MSSRTLQNRARLIMRQTPLDRAVATDAKMTVAGLKKMIRLLLSEDSGRAAARRSLIDSTIGDLQERNPPLEAAYSDKIDGVWTLSYTSSFTPNTTEFGVPANMVASVRKYLMLQKSLDMSIGGFSPGLNLKVGKKQIMIDNGNVEATAEIIMPGSILGPGLRHAVGYKALLVPNGPNRFNEEIEQYHFHNEIGWVEAVTDTSRQVEVVYLDDEMLIVRDNFGVLELLQRGDLDVVWDQAL